MAQNILLIVNPVSGMGRARTALSGILQELCRGGRRVTVCMTEYAGHAGVLAQELGADYDIVACIGGDGTLSSVLNGLMTLEETRRPTVGYIPLGTTNDMATSFGILKNPRQAARRIIEGAPRVVDIGASSAGYFGYVMAFGAFTEVSYSTPQDVKNIFGKFAYFAEGTANLPKLVPAHVTIEYDGGTLEDDFIFGSVSNSTSVAGFLKLTPSQAVLDDGLFEVLLIRNPKNLGELNASIAALLTQSYDSGNVMLLHSKSVRVRSEKPITWTQDGECGGSHTLLEASVCPQAVRILV